MEKGEELTEWKAEFCRLPDAIFYRCTLAMWMWMATSSRYTLLDFFSRLLKKNIISYPNNKEGVRVATTGVTR